MNLGNLNRVIAANHPALPGHFPGDPLVPGVIILEHVVQAIGARFPHIALGALLSARFHAPLRPDEAFCVAAQLRDEQVRFEVRFAARSTETPAESGALIASGQWACRPLSCVVAADV